MILYEYPLNERVRTLLRLEDLFERFVFFLSQEEAKAHHVALITLFEIADMGGRTDLKSKLTKELERQKQALSIFRNNPSIAQAKLEKIITDIEHGLIRLNRMQGRCGQHLMDNEWLNSIRSRSVIPGGTCKFDLPSYYAWQHYPPQKRRNDISKWVTPLLPLYDATSIVLNLSRESGLASKALAVQGSYQQMLSGRIYQMMQVRISPELELIPEASGNKYMIRIRFTQKDSDSSKPRSVDDKDIPFHLTLCNL